MIYQQIRDLARIYPLFAMPNVVAKKSGRNSVCTAEPALSNNRFTGATMPLTRNTPGVCPAQEFTDPLIVNARLVNLAAEIERNLAARKTLRRYRQNSAHKGWETRNGL